MSILSIGGYKMLTFTTLLVLTLNIFDTTLSQHCDNMRAGFTHTFSFRTIVCFNVSDKFPEIPSLTSSISCVNCTVRILSSTSSVPNFRGDMFNMSYGHLTEIRDDAFDKFWPTVKMFKFQNNEIQRVAKGLFHNFTGLKEVTFANNNLSMLEVGQFDGTTIERLDLSGNALENTNNVFEGLQVFSLNLSSNNIGELTQSTFAGLKMMKTAFYQFSSYNGIDLAYNRISSIEPGTFSKLTSDMRTLNLAYNKLTIISNDTFGTMRPMILNLGYNFIVTLEPAAFGGLSSLRTLILSHNSINVIPMGLFSKLRSLETLKLDGNHMLDFTPTIFSGMPGLRYLNVSSNHLSKLTDSILVPLGNLNELDVSYNRLGSLDLETILAHNSRLKKLLLNHNFWQCTQLIGMFKRMVKNSGSFEVTGSDFHVPNLHGIPCSRTTVVVTDDLTFDQFMEDISHEIDLEDLYDVKLQSESHAADTTASYMSAIYYLVLLVAILYTCSVLISVANNVLLYLQRRNIVSKNFRILYNNESNVVLV